MAHSARPEMPTDSEIEAMSLVLLRRYGTRAPQVAAHFMAEHEHVGDAARAVTWVKVRERLGRTAQGTLS